jgi:hypothetical protein
LEYAVAGTAQFTPRQVLEAGRRAEADGKRDYAIQFYQHVLAHHGATAEAIEADDSLRRLTFVEPDDSFSANSHYPLIAQAAATGAYAGQASGQGVGHLNGHAAAHPPHAPFTTGPPLHAATMRPGHVLPVTPQRHTPRTAPPAEPRAGNATPKTSRHPKNVEADVDAHSAQHRKIKRYRLGRFMAALIGFIGGLAALTSLIAIGANLALLLTKPNSLLSMAAISPLFAGGILAGACVLILLSQIAKATFDAARDRTHR